MSARDYFLAKQFDKNNDGILDETETRAAKKAIKEGFNNKFMFGLERAGSVLLQNMSNNAHKMDTKGLATHIRVK